MGYRATSSFIIRITALSKNAIKTDLDNALSTVDVMWDLRQIIPEDHGILH